MLPPTLTVNIFSAGLQEREAYTIGHSVPSSKMCDNTAPMPKGEASQANTIGFWSSKCTSNFGEDNNCLTSARDCYAYHTTPTVCPLITIDIRVPALLLGQAKI